MTRLTGAVVGGAVISIFALAVVGFTRDFRAHADKQKRENFRPAFGDMAVMSEADPFPDLERVTLLVAHADGVAHAWPVGIWPVQLKANAVLHPGLLRLETLDNETARSLQADRATVPPPKSDGAMMPEVTVGNVLASDLDLAVGDVFDVLAAPQPESTEETLVHCRVHAIVNWGVPSHNWQLLRADLSRLPDFSLRVTAIAVVVVHQEERGAVAARLLSQLGRGFRVFTLEQMTETGAVTAAP